MDCRSGGFGGFSRLALGQAITFAVHLEDVDVVDQPVEQCAGQPFRSQRLRPFVERRDSGNQNGSAFVALRDQLEQQFRTGLG